MRRIFKFALKIFLPRKYYDEIFIDSFIKDDYKKLLNLKEIIWCFLHGFQAFEYVWYDLSKHDYRNYLPSRNSYKKRHLNGEYNSILGNKLIFEMHLKTILAGIDNIKVIESVGFVEDGLLQAFHKDIIQGEVTSLIPLIEEGGLILKPISSDGGVGVFLLEKIDGGFLINKKEHDWTEVKDFLSSLDNYLIQRRFIQSGFSNKIYGGSLNTLRIATMVNPVSHLPFIAYAVHRFGSFSSGFLDNVNQGGITAMIDLKTGKLFHGQNFTAKAGRQDFEIHPISGNPITGETIPNWQYVTEKILEMSTKMPYLKYVGWDVIISDNEIYILEGNVAPGLGLIQMFKPLKEFNQAWDFLKYYKFIG